MAWWNQKNNSGDDEFLQRFLAQGGEVYGVVLNDKPSLRKLEKELTQTPYKSPPNGTVMYIKPRNTFIGNGAEVSLPHGEDSVEIGATLGVVMAKSTSRVTAEQAPEYIAGYLPVADLSLPHASYYRPAIREKCFDGACPLGQPVDAAVITDVSELEIIIYVNDERVGVRSLAELNRLPNQLISDVSEFMTIKQGDILLMGVTYQAPQAKTGDKVRVEIDRVGVIEFVVTETTQGA